MYNTVKDAPSYGSGVVGTAVAAGAIVFGMVLLAVTAATEEPEEMDTTTRLLSGGNRDRVLQALAQYERGQFTKRDLIEGS